VSAIFDEGRIGTTLRIRRVPIMPSAFTSSSCFNREHLHLIDGGRSAPDEKASLGYSCFRRSSLLLMNVPASLPGRLEPQATARLRHGPRSILSASGKEFALKHFDDHSRLLSLRPEPAIHGERAPPQRQIYLCGPAPPPIENPGEMPLPPITDPDA